MRTVKKLSPERQAELKRRYMAGEKYIVIQHEMGICRTTIERYIYRLSMPLRQPWQSKRERKTNDQTSVQH